MRAAQGDTAPQALADSWADVVRLVGGMSLDLRADVAAAVDELLIGECGAREQAETRLQLALGGLRGWAWEWDLRNDAHWQSQGWEEVLGYGPGQMVAGCDVLEALVHPDDKARVRRQLIDHLLGRSPRYESEHRVAAKDGRWLWMLDRGRIVEHDHNLRPVRIIGVRIDVTDRKIAEEQVYRSEQRLKTVLDNLDEGVIAVAPGYTSGFVNRAAVRILTGREPTARVPSFDELKLEDYEFIDAAGSLVPMSELPLARVMRGDRVSELVLRVRSKTSGRERHLVFNGSPALEDQKLSLAIIAFHDTTDKLRAEHRARWAVSHDTLTELPNRERFVQHLRSSIGSGRLQKTALLVFDIDSFGALNDTLGHPIGDEVLRRVGRRIRGAIRSSDFLARLGSDEFAVLLPVNEKADRLHATAARVLKEIRRPLHIEGNDIELRASVGGTTYPKDGIEPLELIKNADLALRAAKSAGGGRCVFYRPTMRRELERRAQHLANAREAIARGVIRPFYQPKVNLVTGHIVGFEALARRSDNKESLGLPRGFADAFEDAELAPMIGACLLDTVLADMRRWTAAGLLFGHVAINVSAVELRDEGFAARLLARLAAEKIPPHLLEVEVTENVLFGHSGGRAEAIVTELSRGGVRVALDDFGTGYASLSHLKALPVDVLKIDRSFVSGLSAGSGDHAIASAIIALGRSLGKEVVAEGIETVDQAALLRRRGCEIGQGFWYSRPLPAAEVPQYLRLHQPLMADVEAKPRRRSGASQLH